MIYLIMHQPIDLDHSAEYQTWVRGAVLWGQTRLILRERGSASPKFCGTPTDAHTVWAI